MRFIVSLVLAFPVSSLASDVGSEVANWYRSQYAPYFESPSPADANEIRDFYVDGYFQHFGAAGVYVATNTEAEWADFISDELEAGWEGSTVVSVLPRVLNEWNVTLTVRWLRKGEGEVCHWYLVTKQEDRWRFSNLVGDVLCPSD